MPTIRKNEGGRPWKKKIEPKRDQFYTSTLWRNRRKVYLFANPLCEVSLAMGKHVEATIVDHIVSRRTQGGHPLDGENLMGMSHFFHQKKRQLEKGGYCVKKKPKDMHYVPCDRVEIIDKLLEGVGERTHPFDPFIYRF